MPFAYGDDAESVCELPDLGSDFSNAYGYVQEHHTAELWLRMWQAHAEDVEKNGSPTTYHRLIDLVYSFWNTCIGNVDTVRKIVKRIKAVRGPDSGPGSLMWYNLLDYTFPNGFRVYQYTQLESKLDSFTSFKELQKARQKITLSSDSLHVNQH